MTDPIAVDVPAKPAFGRSLPLPTPAPTPAGAAPKPDALKTESPKPDVSKAEAPKVDAAKLATAAVGSALGVPPVGPLTPAPAVASKALGGLLARITKKQAIMAGSAILSLAAGVAGVRMIFPAKDDQPPTAALAPNTPTLTSPTKSQPKPDASSQPGTGDFLPAPGLPIPTVPVAPIPPAGGSPSSTLPLIPPPSMALERPEGPTGAIPPSFAPPISPTPPTGLLPTGGVDTPATPGIPPIPPPTGVTPPIPLPVS
ncbi:MAG: hypothetical protein L0241_19185, partial [Planctomycetia bacterium]|nr:hypothetical protein [Planctomycetia bacterium]